MCLVVVYGVRGLMSHRQLLYLVVNGLRGTMIHRRLMYLCRSCCEVADDSSYDHRGDDSEAVNNVYIS